MINTDNPYIGPRSFTRQEADRFFGREAEAADLLSLVIAERLVLFYAQSGAGKTSLINTSLIPDLEENGRAVLPVSRVGGELPVDITEADNIFTFSLMSQLDQGGTAPALLARLDLSTFLRDLVSSDGQTYRYESPAENEQIADNPQEGPIYVLIIDQFEEILTAHSDRWQDRAEFFRQLNRAMQDDPKLSVVLSLREDYVAALEPYAPLLIDRMRARFYMERMGRGAALSAVKKPAEKVGRPFAPGAAETLVDNLSLIRSARSSEPRPGQYIEPVQLQVVCFQLWRNLPPGEEITQEQISRIGNIDHALANFYEQAVAETLLATNGSELELRQWFERRLITEAGTRGTVFQGETHSGGMDNQMVRLLEDRFLLRAESRSGAVWYELVHDRFVEPILQANQKWMKTQGPLLRDALAWEDSGRLGRHLLYINKKLQNALAEITEQNLTEPVVQRFLIAGKNEQKNIEEREKARERELAANRKFHTWFKMAVVVAVVAALASLWAGWATYRAKNAEQSALNSQKKTEDTLARLQKTEALNTGMGLNAKAEAAESKGSRLYAHLYSLHALDKLTRNKDSDAYMEAVIRAQANPALSPAFIGHHVDDVNAAVFSPDGRYVISAADDKTIGIWDGVTGEKLRSIDWNIENVSQGAFSQDGRFLASTVRNNNFVNIWEVSTGELTHTLKGHTDVINKISFSPNGQLVATGSKDKTIGIWDALTGKHLHTLKTHNSVFSVTFSPDNHLVASVSMGYGTAIWNVQTGQLLKTFPEPDSAYCVAFSPDGQTLASGSYGEINLWDIQSTNRLKTFRDDGGSGAIGLSFSPDSRFLTSTYFDKKINIWNVQTGQHIRLLDGYKFISRNSRFSPDGQTIMTSGYRNNTIGLLEKLTDRFLALKGHTDQVQGIWFSPDSHTLASVAKDKTISIWDIATGRRLRTVTLQASGRIGGMSNMPFSPNGQLVASTSWDNNRIILWEVSSGKRLMSLKGHTDEVTHIMFSPDGKNIVSDSWDDMVKIWNIKSGKKSNLVKDNVLFSRISFSPDSRIIAVSRIFKKGIDIFDIVSGNKLKTLAAKEEVEAGAIFSPGGKSIASVLQNNTIAIWDVFTGQRLQLLTGHSQNVDRLSFSPSGSILASSSFFDKTIAIWDVKTGKRIRTLKENNIAPEGIIAFSPDGKTLAFTTDDNAIGLWDLQPTVNEFSGISLDENGEYKIDLDTLPYKLEGLELKPIKQKQNTPDKPARWSRYHPFHWLPAAEKGDSNAMLQIGIIYDRNNDIARALRWYGKAIKAGNEQAQKQQDILLHWLKDKENREQVPGPFMQSLCKSRSKFDLPNNALQFCDQALSND